MGIELDGRRRTRSSARTASTPTPATPPPAKKPRTNTTPSRRGRQKQVEEESDAKEESLVDNGSDKKEENSIESSPKKDKSNNEPMEVDTEKLADIETVKEKAEEAVDNVAAVSKPETTEEKSSVVNAAVNHFEKEKSDESANETVKLSNSDKEVKDEPMTVASDVVLEKIPSSVEEKKIEEVKNNKNSTDIGKPPSEAVTTATLKVDEVKPVTESAKIEVNNVDKKHTENKEVDGGAPVVAPAEESKVEVASGKSSHCQ